MSLVYEDDWLTVHGGDSRSVMLSMAAESVDCIVTSPPYFGLRDYGLPPAVWGETGPCEHEWGDVMPDPHVSGTSVGGRLGSDKPGGGRATARSKTGGQFCRKCPAWKGQLGLEPTPGSYVGHLVEVFDAAWQVLKPSGSLWLTLGDSFADRPLPGIKAKDLIGTPWAVAFALRDAGWYLRTDVVWTKPNPLPESPNDRPNRSHEFIFLLTKSADYYYNWAAVVEPSVTGTWATDDGMRRMRDVWNIPTVAYPDAHYAVFPPDLVARAVKAGCPSGGVVLDCFAGSGTVGLVAQSLSRRAVLIDLQPDYLVQQFKRAGQRPLGLEVT